MKSRFIESWKCWTVCTQCFVCLTCYISFAIGCYQSFASCELLAIHTDTQCSNGAILNYVSSASNAFTTSVGLSITHFVTIVGCLEYCLVWWTSCIVVILFHVQYRTSMLFNSAVHYPHVHWFLSESNFQTRQICGDLCGLFCTRMSWPLLSCDNMFLALQRRWEGCNQSLAWQHILTFKTGLWRSWKLCWAWTLDSERYLYLL